MPRRSASIHEKKIPSLPVPVNSQRPSFLQTMKEGLALGVGSSIGHRIVSAAFGVPPSSSEEYEQCMKKYDDIAACKRFLGKDN